MGIEILLWSCFVLIARVYSPFVLFLFQNFLPVISEASFYQLEGLASLSLTSEWAPPCPVSESGGPDS